MEIQFNWCVGLSPPKFWFLSSQISKSDLKLGMASVWIGILKPHIYEPNERF